MKKILVPVDFSTYSMNAARYAAEIARKTGADLYFLHVVNIPSYEGNLPFQEQQNVAEGLFILKLVKKKFAELMEKDFLKGIKCIEAIQFDGVYESITEQAEKNNIDLIVMGTHGSSGAVSDYFVGSNTDKIVRRSKIPIIAIPAQVKEPQFKNIVFASDFLDDVDQAFAGIRYIADQWDATIHLLRVSTHNPFFYTVSSNELMTKFAQKHQLKKYTVNIHNAADVQSGIIEFAAMHEADLVSTATNGRKGLARLFNGSITESMIKSTTLPVMTIKI